MKTERARELYSDYAEGVLSPALAQALEQHFESEPDARADYEQFQQVYSLLDTMQGDEVAVPLGFRATVLDLAAEEHARREATPSVAGWFSGLNPFRRRQATGGLIAAFAVLALAAVVVNVNKPPRPPGPGVGCFIGPCSSDLPETTIKSVESTPLMDGGTTQRFHIHLPASIPQASVMAYVIQDVDQIANPQSAVPALAQPQELTNNEELQIPVTLQHASLPGSTLDLLVQWTPDGGTQPSGSQVVFAPLQQGVAQTEDGSAPVSGNYFKALQDLAAQYNVTIIADAGSTPNTTIAPPPTSDDALKAIQDVAGQVKYSVQKLDNTTYQIYSQP
jgi:hypothetical protein